MAKFSLEFKKEVSEKYLEDELSLKSVARMYDISPCTIRKWAYAYREHGIGVLTVKWFTEFGHLNRGDMLTSEQHRCTNEKKKF
jgi:transposase